MIQDELIEAFRSAIARLQQLHVLSQTETLMLDEADSAGLDEVTEAKELLVARIVELQAPTSSIRAQFDLESVEDDQRELLQELGRQAAILIAKISELDRENRTRLEHLRSQALQSLLAVHHERRLNRAYRP
jgi:hypothetical protein